VRVLTRLTRLAANPWLRLGLLALVLAFCGYGLDREWSQVATSLHRLHWYSLAGSLVAAMAGSSCLMLAWRAVLSDLGSPLSVRVAARVNFVAQLAKYVPGAVWAFAAQVELGHDYEVPRRRSLASVVTSLAVMVGSGIGVALVTLPVTSPSVVRQYWWVVCTVPVLLAVLCPPVLGRILDRLLTLLRFQPLERRPTWHGLGRALAWNLAGWLVLGVAVWLLAGGMAGLRPGLLVLALGGYALAYSAGLLLVILPSGLGARDIILVATLSEALPHGTAVAVALVARAVTTLSDVALGGLSIALGRKRAADAGQAGVVPNGTIEPPSKSSSLSSSS
jgi:glycosyltransferase 2 family protein